MRGRAATGQRPGRNRHDRRPPRRRSGHLVAGQGFVVLDGSQRAFTLAHASPNFDRTGLAADLNVVYPVDRLAELAERCVIGSVASQHLSLMGAQVDHPLTTLRLDSGPAAAELLKADSVDVVLLTPV